MSHKADKSFFTKKRSWSKRKDKILGSYLTAYLPKIATQKKPILIVDAFAGPGVFDDHELGSPLIISNVIRNASAKTKPLPVEVSLWAVENEPILHELLLTNLLPFPFAKAIQSTFLAEVPRIREAAASHSVFLYVDPYTVEGLEWKALDQIFEMLRTGVSVEILMNLNVPSFVRRGLAALQVTVPEKDIAIEDIEELDELSSEPPSLGKLDQMAGGNWWRKVLNEPAPFVEQVHRVASHFAGMLSKRFNEVCIHEVKAAPTHTIPKYYLIFGSRHPHALRLMNDEMVKSRNVLADLARPNQPTLFELRPTDLVPDSERLPELVLYAARIGDTRGSTILRIIRKNFCQFSSAQIRSCIEDLLKQGKLCSGKNHWRINDDIKIWIPR